MSLWQCPECKQNFSDTATACPHCGYTWIKQKKWSPGIAALLSLIIPGAGQLYRGKLSGLLWFIFVIGGYVFFIIPGLFLHFICIISAYSGDTSK